MVYLSWLSWEGLTPPLGGASHTPLRQDMKARKLFSNENKHASNVRTILVFL